MVDHALLVWLGIVGVISVCSSWLRIQAEDREAADFPERGPVDFSVVDGNSEAIP